MKIGLKIKVKKLPDNVKIWCISQGNLHVFLQLRDNDQFFSVFASQGWRSNLREKGQIQGRLIRRKRKGIATFRTYVRNSQ
jgi:REP element-mobilizing transposase RayT